MDRKDELLHYGILGMKWGIRRFQPYPKGYKGSGKFLPSPGHRGSRKTQHRIARTMSDSELKTAVNRLNLEQQYVNLTSKQKNKGRGVVTKTLNEVGKNIARDQITKQATKVGKKAVQYWRNN